MIRRKRRLAVSVKLAVAILAPAKVGASVNIADNTLPALDGNDSTIGAALQDFVSKKSGEVSDTGRHALQAAASVWKHVVDAAAPDTVAGTTAPMMTEAELRLFLQSYNAGPYATLKHKGNVPFRETRNYVPRVMKYYQQDLSKTPYDHIVVEKAKKYGLDPQLIRAMMKTESNFNRRTVSSAGARGLMQVMPVVWKEVMKRYDLGWNYNKEVFDPEKNIDVACAYLAWLRFDFLPRHFNEFDRNPQAPTYVVRDKIRPDSKRITVASLETDKETKTVASAAKEVASSSDGSTKSSKGSSESSSKETTSKSDEMKSVAAEPAKKAEKEKSTSKETASKDSSSESKKAAISITDSKPKKAAKAASSATRNEKNVTITRDSNKKIVVKVSGKGNHQSALATAKRAIQ